MDQVIEFVTNHWELVLAFVVTLAALIYTESRKGGKSVSTHVATGMINKEDAVVVDIRSQKDFGNGHIRGAINIPYADFDKRMDELEKHKEQPVIIVCNIGQTSGAVTKKLKNAGFNAARLRGGITEWKGQNLPVVKK